jgi:hypothetical protein
MTRLLVVPNSTFEYEGMDFDFSITGILSLTDINGQWLNYFIGDFSISPFDEIAEIEIDDDMFSLAHSTWQTWQNTRPSPYGRIS